MEYSMTADDKNEIKEIVTQALKVQSLEVGGRLTIIESRLTNIDNHLAKLNSKVAKHEENFNRMAVNEQKNLDFFANREATCPMNNKLRALEDNNLSNASVKKFLFTSIGLTATVVGIISAIINILLK